MKFFNYFKKPVSSGKKSCPACNKENRGDAKFCIFCATSFSRGNIICVCGASNDERACFCQQCARPLEANMSEEGKEIDSLAIDSILMSRYKILERIGVGGMGAVYKAIDIRLGNKIVAVKEMNAMAVIEIEDRESVLEAFRKEAEMLANLNHPNIPRVTDYFNYMGNQYLIMDFIDGITMASFLKITEDLLTESRIIEWALQLCEVLNYLHNQSPSIIFRDLKPANIMIDHKENLKLIDFGIARLFKAGKNSDTIYLGTPGYAPPEQYGKSQTDARSDIYSLGATLHYLTTGRDPGTSPFSFSPVRNFNPHISEALENLIMKAVKFKPHERWQNIIEMKQVLSSLRTQVETAGIKVPQEPSTSIYKTETPNPLVVSLSGLCDYQTISEAIKVAKAGTIIYVHSGIYREGLILDRAVEIIGEGKEGEIIIESENSSCILMETEEASIRNLTLRCTAGIKKYYGVDIPRGRLVIEDCDIRSDSLACIGIHGAKAAPVIRKCKIHDGERGIVFSKEGKGNIEECEIFCNKKENIKITEKSDPFIKQSKIYKGKNGGIIITTKGLGTFEECEIYDNTLSGIIISREGNPIIKRCKIYNGSRGILVSENGAGLLEECHIFNNTKSGVEILDRGNPTLSHCRIYDGNLQGIYIYKKGEGTIKNCELSGNKGAGIEITSEGNPIIKNCKIFNGKSYGIYIWLKGAGTFEECEIFGNVLPGMEIGENCNPTVKNCTIN